VKTQPRFANWWRAGGRWPEDGRDATWNRRTTTTVWSSALEIRTLLWVFLVIHETKYSTLYKVNLRHCELRLCNGQLAKINTSILYFETQMMKKTPNIANRFIMVTRSKNATDTVWNSRLSEISTGGKLARTMKDKVARDSEIFPCVHQSFLGESSTALWVEMWSCRNAHEAPKNCGGWEADMDSCSVDQER
jgi:hypothetical protein